MRQRAFMVVVVAFWIAVIVPLATISDPAH